MKRKLNTYSKGFDYLETNEVEPLELIRNPKYRRKDLDIEARILNHWDKMDLLLNKNVTGAWYTFSLSESFWLKIIQKLRAYNLPLEIIKQLKDFLNSHASIIENSNIDDDLADYLLSIDASLTRDEFQKFIKSAQFLDYLKTLKPTYLENILLDLIVTRSDIRILINEFGEVNILKSENIVLDLDNQRKLNEFLSKTYLNISLYEIIKELVKDLGEDECSEYQNILTKDEAMILKLLKQDDISKIEINYNDKTKKAESIKITNKNIVSNLSKIQDLIIRNGYQDITIKTQNGHITHCTNTTKYKLDTE